METIENIIIISYNVKAQRFSSIQKLDKHNYSSAAILTKIINT